MRDENIYRLSARLLCHRCNWDVNTLCADQYREADAMNPLLKSFLKAVRAKVYEGQAHRLIRKRVKSKQPVKLELGVQGHKGEDWLTVDVANADIKYDLRKGIPFPDNTVSFIYTSNFLEHVPYKELIVLIKECKRVLTRHGMLSVCVPDARRYIDAYLEGKPAQAKGDCFQPALVDTGSAIDTLNYIAYMGGEHHYLFDKENLINTLKRGGFENAFLRRFDASLDQQHYEDNGSIYAVAFADDSENHISRVL